MGRPGKRAEWEDTKDKAAPADGAGKKLERGRLIFRKEGTKGVIKRLALWFGVVNWKIEIENQRE